MISRSEQIPLPSIGVGNEPVAEDSVIDRPGCIGQAEVFYCEVGEILTRATGFMEEYDFTLNPYSGCSFGCTYCYAAFFGRTKADRDAWGFRVTVKCNAVELLSRRKRSSLDGKKVYMSSVTDPYQPIERELKVARGLLEVMAERHKPNLVIQTRSPDVVRDCDLFLQIEATERDMLGGVSKEGGRVQVNMTVTTDDEDVRRTFEPFCPSNSQRLRAIAEVKAAGVDACITLTPLIWVKDPESFAESLLETGVTKFIVQPFHFQRGKFVAGTRDEAFRLMAEKLKCDLGSFRRQYDQHYAHVRQVLKDALPHLGEGKDGFAPPF